MLNLLIAQMADTFSNVQGDAQRSLAINKARTIISIEKTGLSFLVSLYQIFDRNYVCSNFLGVICGLWEKGPIGIHNLST